MKREWKLVRRRNLHQRTVELHCDYCEEETEHAISDNGLAECTVCGQTKVYVTR